MPGDSQEPADAVARPVRPVGSVNPRFAQDKVVDVYWQHVLEQYQQGNSMPTPEDLQYFKNAHPIARALAEGDSHSFGSQTQAAAASPEASSRMEQLPEVSIQRQQPAVEPPEVSIQQQQTVSEPQPAVAQTVTQEEPETPVAGSSSGALVSNSQEA